MSTPPDHHTVVVLVENKAGVLARVVALFARRGFNIYSLAVAPTADDRFSRITIVVDTESNPIEQITKQLDKLINVLEIEALAPGQAVERELMLATVAASSAARSELLELVRIFDAQVLNVGVTEIMIGLSGSPNKLDDFTDLLRPYGIVTHQRTGRVALPKLERTVPAPAAQ